MIYLINQILRQLSKFDLLFILLILLLQAFGLLALYSATHGAYSENMSLFRQQIIWFSLGWSVFFIMGFMSHSFISKMMWFVYGFHVAALIFILFTSSEIFGTKRWIDLGFFNYQPSETLKIILIIVVAKYLSMRKFKLPLDFISLLFFFIVISIPISLVLIQPDLGTAGIILIILGTMILFNGIQKKLFIALLALMLISLPVAWNFVLKPYQKSRITNFIQPEKNPQGAGYNVIQSKIAIGSGKILGKGFKKGTQNRLQFLPERHTDFIFSVVSEEYGLLGSTIILILFFLLIGYMLRLASISRDLFSCYLCLGTGFYFLFHVVLNISMTMGLFPVVGAPLPLLSYGGSHTLTSMCLLGVVAYTYKKRGLFYSK